MRNVIKTINIQGFFEMNRDIYDLEYYSDKREELSKKHWFSLIDYLKEKLLYTNYILIRSGLKAK